MVENKIKGEGMKTLNDWSLTFGIIAVAIVVLIVLTIFLKIQTSGAEKIVQPNDLGSVGASYLPASSIAIMSVDTLGNATIRYGWQWIIFVRDDRVYSFDSSMVKR